MGLGNTHQEVIFGLLVGANNKIDTVMPFILPTIFENRKIVGIKKQ